MVNRERTNKKSIELTLGYSDVTHSILSVPKLYRSFFPGYKTTFVLKTNVGELEAYVSSAPKGTKIGDPNAGRYITGSLNYWYHNNKAQEDDRVRVTQIKKYKKYEIKKLKRK